MNQYGGSEGFLGWLALQPKFHRESLDRLTASELQHLGPNIRDLDAALTRYWSLTFPDDPVRRVYIVYFFESAFQDPPDVAPYHLHLHIIPRFDSLDEPDRLQTTKDGTKWVDGWQMPLLHRRDVIPREYRRESADWTEQVNRLMTYLTTELDAGDRP